MWHYSDLTRLTGKSVDNEYTRSYSTLCRVMLSGDFTKGKKSSFLGSHPRISNGGVNDQFKPPLLDSTISPSGGHLNPCTRVEKNCSEQNMPSMNFPHSPPPHPEPPCWRNKSSQGSSCHGDAIDTVIISYYPLMSLIQSKRNSQVRSSVTLYTNSLFPTPKPRGCSMCESHYHVNVWERKRGTWVTKEPWM